MEYNLKIEKCPSDLYYISCEHKQEPLCRAHLGEILIILYQYAVHPDRKNCFKKPINLSGPFNRKEKEILENFRQITLNSLL